MGLQLNYLQSYNIRVNQFVSSLFQYAIVKSIITVIHINDFQVAVGTNNPNKRRPEISRGFHMKQLLALNIVGYVHQILVLIWFCLGVFFIGQSVGDQVMLNSIQFTKTVKHYSCRTCGFELLQA